jgi:putative colanic acid biosynthesis acetyltransferase WcaB
MSLLKARYVTGDNGKDSFNRDRNPLFWEVIRRDQRANRMNPKGQLVLFAFRLAHVFATARDTNRILWIVGLPILILYRILVEWTLCVELPAKTDIGAGLKLYHGQALVVNDHARIGSDCTLRHCTTIGSKVLASGEEGPSPALGDRVDVGSNVVILGGISIGDDVTIGAGSVVIRDVADGAVVAGNPARVLYYR